ncbi:hypothetical protein [Glaciimonas immobilis]|uniref:Biofilm PGA synthesis protein PgaA n=1 Tax=Glaciimonas immobilis TaxID=728004 RepID=A0A840RV43_9BURK|nr:hypothetical protein [Glaciimonas immobilis]KAF3996132.1 hypothetical protein HAV38_20540 [Glaciimonas immobilis]MBB5201715.1 biofilm PGA synthesis protein PgaA [Glaciimonas immobilis]
MINKSKSFLLTTLLAFNAPLHAVAVPAKPETSLAADRVEGIASKQPGALPLSITPQVIIDPEDLVERLKTYDQQLAIAPEDAAAREGRLLVISRLGAPASAIEEAKQYPNISSEVVQRLYEDQTALAIRWSEKVYHSTPGGEYPAYDHVIYLGEETWKRYPLSERSRFDLVRALNNRKRRAEAVALYETLQRDKLEIPGYVHEAAGSAYLAEKKPELSVRSYNAALIANPNSFDANMGLFYALADMSDYKGAKQHIETFSAKPMDPQEKFESATAAIMEMAYENRLGVAQSRLIALQNEAPNSQLLHLALAKTYLWRGWPRRAMQELDFITQRESYNLQANTAMVVADAAMGDYRSSAARLSQLQASTPDDTDVKNLTRAQAVRDMNELTLIVSGTRSKENLGNGRGFIVDTKVKGHPINFQMRPFVHEYFERGINRNDSADYRRLGAGIDYVIPSLGEVEGEIQQEFFMHPKTSIAVQGKFDLNDYWKYSIRLDSDPVDVPLEARRARVSGRLAAIGAAYRASELFAVHADFSQLNMSDHNIRRDGLIGGTAKLVEGPRYKGTLGLDVSLSTNSLANASYYNPKKVRAAQISFANEWINYQRYDRSFGQQLIFSLGRSAEEGFRTGTIGGIGYEQRVSLSDVVALSYSFGYVRKIYSGVLSKGPEANLSLNWKF